MNLVLPLRSVGLISRRFREERRLVYEVEMSDSGVKIMVRINFLSANLEKESWPPNKSIL
jgi:Txe/YoeB family toxin of Txe-Axe toxin-antitoxin module